MKNLTAILILIATAIAGCTDHAPAMAPDQKETLRKTLIADFPLPSISGAKEEDSYRVLETFAARRKPNEFVRKIDFNAAMDEAGLSFDDGGMHGGGFVTLKKKNGRWVVDGMWYQM